MIFITSCCIFYLAIIIYYQDKKIDRLASELDSIKKQIESKE